MASYHNKEEVKSYSLVLISFTLLKDRHNVLTNDNKSLMTSYQDF